MNITSHEALLQKIDITAKSCNGVKELSAVESIRHKVQDFEFDILKTKCNHLENSCLALKKQNDDLVERVTAIERDLFDNKKVKKRQEKLKQK